MSEDVYRRESRESMLDTLVDGNREKTNTRVSRSSVNLNEHSQSRISCVVY